MGIKLLVIFSIPLFTPDETIKAVRTRPSTLAAKEFFAGERNWKSLPLRIRRLVDVFESWVRVLSFSLLRSFQHIIS